jgi:hypothetical protein
VDTHPRPGPGRTHGRTRGILMAVPGEPQWPSTRSLTWPTSPGSGLIAVDYSKTWRERSHSAPRCFGAPGPYSDRTSQRNLVRRDQRTTGRPPTGPADRATFVAPEWAQAAAAKRSEGGKRGRAQRQSSGVDGD